MKRVFVLLAIAASQCVEAAGSSQGLVTGPLSTDAGKFMFSAGPHVNKPSCSTLGNDWALDVSTASGKSMQATVMLAYAMGKTLHVEGLGDCRAWPDREAPNYLYMID